MWMLRRTHERVVRGLKDAAAGEIRVQKAIAARERALREASDARCAEITRSLVELSKRPVQVVPPPDTHAIVNGCLEGMATVLNGWRGQVAAGDVNVQLPLSLDQQGLDASGGVRPSDLDGFMPPWEQMEGPPPRHAEFYNARVGNYVPYVPGDGNTTIPKGGME